MVGSTVTSRSEYFVNVSWTQNKLANLFDFKQLSFKYFDRDKIHQFQIDRHCCEFHATLEER